MKNSWWKVPLYCIVASCICFQLEIKLLGKLALITLPDGSITADNDKWMIISAFLFAAVVILGGLFIFRKMSRKEILFSALIMAGINVIMGLISLKAPIIAVYWPTLTEWDSIISQLLFRITDNARITSPVYWIIPPFIFVLFGRKSKE